MCICVLLTNVERGSVRLKDLISFSVQDGEYESKTSILPTALSHSRTFWFPQKE